MWRDALLVAGKDLRVEVRTRVGLGQVAPFAVLVLVLFGFALDPDRGVLVLTPQHKRELTTRTSQRRSFRELPLIEEQP